MSDTDSGKIIRDPATGRLMVEGADPKPLPAPIPQPTGAKAPRNGYTLALGIVGALALIAGIITWMIGAQQAAFAKDVSSYGVNLGLADAGNVEAANGLLWTGIITTILGAVLLLIVIGILAASSSRK